MLLVCFGGSQQDNSFVWVHNMSRSSNEERLFLAIIASGLYNKESSARNDYVYLIVLKGSLTSAVPTNLKSTVP